MTNSVIAILLAIILLVCSCRKNEVPTQNLTCWEMQDQLTPEVKTLSGKVFWDCMQTLPAINKLIVLNTHYSISGDNSQCSLIDSIRTDSTGNYLFTYNFYHSNDIADYFYCLLTIPEDSFLVPLSTSTSSFDISIKDTFRIKLKIFFSASFTSNDTLYYAAHGEKEKFIVGPFPEVSHGTLYLTKVKFYSDGFNSTFITYGIGWKNYAAEFGHINGDYSVVVDHPYCSPIDSASILVK